MLRLEKCDRYFDQPGIAKVTTSSTVVALKNILFWIIDIDNSDISTC